MVQQTGKEKGVLRSIDWWTIIIYLALLSFGWVSVCDLQSRHAFGYADRVDRHLDRAGVHPADARRPLLRYVCLYHLRCDAGAVVWHHLQSAYD